MILYCICNVDINNNPTIRGPILCIECLEKSLGETGQARLQGWSFVASDCLSVCLSDCPSVWMSVCLSGCLYGQVACWGEKMIERG